MTEKKKGQDKAAPSPKPSAMNPEDFTVGGGAVGGPKMGQKDGVAADFIPVLGNQPECDGCSALILGEFAKSFDKSAKRWELIVYPSLFAFIVLAMYGFFLIFSLTQDIRKMAHSIDPQMEGNMEILAENISSVADNITGMSTQLEFISDNMETMSVEIRNMSENMESMTGNIGTLTTHVQGMHKNTGDMVHLMQPIAGNIAGLNQAVHGMNWSVAHMGRDMNSATRPMSFMNKFMPWGN